MTGDSSARVKLCPHCANSIAADATDCRYCKVNLSSGAAPEWLRRGPGGGESRTSRSFSIPPKAIWVGAILAACGIAFFAGRQIGWTEQSQSSNAAAKQLEANEQVIKTQESELAEARRQLDDTARQLAELKTKFEIAEKELSALQQRASLRQAAQPNTRGPVTARTIPAPQEAPKRAAASGLYETIRATTVHERPSPGSRVVSQIPERTRINVAGSAGEWLEVRSKHGNPPGYIRADDARVLGRMN